MIDILGHPVKKGMTVLTNAHWSTAMTEITTVDKVTPKAVYVTIHATGGYWDTENKKFVRTSGNKQMRRSYAKVLVIDKQLKHNRKNYPENMI